MILSEHHPRRVKRERYSPRFSARHCRVGNGTVDSWLYLSGRVALRRHAFYGTLTQPRTVDSKLHEQSSACVPLAILLGAQVRHGGFVLWRTRGSRYIDGLGFDRWPELGVEAGVSGTLSLPGGGELSSEAARCSPNECLVASFCSRWTIR